MRLCVLTGAGMSAESGIPTFRDAQTGLWARFKPGDLASPEAYQRDPALVWGWYRWRAAKVAAAQPNAGHRILAALQAQHDVHIVTQNVDNLHERAGSKHVTHLHGEIMKSRCFVCGHYQTPDAILHDIEQLTEEQHEAPPNCQRCDGSMRPDVVWFGEALPDEAWQAAVQAVDAADEVWVIGTSNLVQPAAQLPVMALHAGKTVVEINPEPTPLTPYVHQHLAMRASEGVQQLVDQQ